MAWHAWHVACALSVELRGDLHRRTGYTGATWSGKKYGKSMEKRLNVSEECLRWNMLEQETTRSLRFYLLRLGQVRNMESILINLILKYLKYTILFLKHCWWTSFQKPHSEPRVAKVSALP